MPKLVWESCTDILSEDILYIERKKRKNPGELKKYFFKYVCALILSSNKLFVIGISGLILSEEEVLNETLVLIEKILRSKNSSLAKWETMPKPVLLIILFMRTIYYKRS